MWYIYKMTIIIRAKVPDNIKVVPSCANYEISCLGQTPILHGFFTTHEKNYPVQTFRHLLITFISLKLKQTTKISIPPFPCLFLPIYLISSTDLPPTTERTCQSWIQEKLEVFTFKPYWGLQGNVATSYICPPAYFESVGFTSATSHQVRPTCLELSEYTWAPSLRDLLYHLIWSLPLAIDTWYNMHSLNWRQIFTQ
jgi:hypothetical protein